MKPLNSTPYTPPSPVLPVPTSPLQQTESESYEFERMQQGGRSNEFDQYNRSTNDTITDRVRSNSGS